MKILQIITFLLLPYHFIGQNYLVESKDKCCILYDVKNGFDVVDTLEACNSCTMINDHLFLLRYYYPTFNPPPIISLSEWSVSGNSIVEVSKIEHRLKGVIPFDKTDFSLSNGFLVGTYRNENCIEIINKKMVLLGLTQTKLDQFFLDFIVTG